MGGADSLHSDRTARLEAAFAREELLGLRLAVRVRAAALLVLAAWVPIENPFPEFLYFYGVLVLFALLGFAPLRLARTGRYHPWMRYLFSLLDISLLTLAVVIPNPLEHELLPPQQLLRFGNELYLFVFIVVAAFSYSPGVVLWSGFCAATAWSVATLTIAALPDSIGYLAPAAWRAMSDAEKQQFLLDPHRVHFGLWGRQVVLFLVTAAGLAVFVHRTRRLVAQQAEAERERANLSRYFSPNVVDELARSDQPLGRTHQQDVAVLFADIVGFTGLAEHMPPAAVIELLRAYHRRLERLVFDHGGTLDKYLGDGLMATFGTPTVGPADASTALRCARAMVTSLRAWNAERRAHGEPVVPLSIGVHYGRAVLGNIGGEARLEYAVIGDTVNVASRLEQLTRAYGASILASDALMAAARAERPPDLDALTADFLPAAPEVLRGRAAPLPLWYLQR